MYRIDKQDVSTIPSIPIAKDLKHFDTNTILPDWWLNIIQEELRNIVIGAGMTPDKNDNAQVYKAIKQLVTTAYMNRYVTPYYYVEDAENDTQPPSPSGFVNPKSYYSLPSLGGIHEHRYINTNKYATLYSMRLYNTIPNTKIKLQLVTLYAAGAICMVYLDGALQHTFNAGSSGIQIGIDGKNINDYTIELTLPDANTEYLLQYVVHSTYNYIFDLLGNFFTGTGIIFRPYK